MMFGISKVKAAMLSAYTAGLLVAAFLSIKPSLWAIVIVMLLISYGQIAIAGWAERK